MLRKKEEDKIHLSRESADTSYWHIYSFHHPLIYWHSVVLCSKKKKKIPPPQTWLKSTQFLSFPFLLATGHKIVVKLPFRKILIQNTHPHTFVVIMIYTNISGKQLTVMVKLTLKWPFCWLFLFSVQLPRLESLLCKGYDDPWTHSSCPPQRVTHLSGRSISDTSVMPC